MNGRILIRNSGADFALQTLHHILPESTANVFAAKPLAVLMDPTLSLAAKTVFDGVALLAWLGEGVCQHPIEIIGALVNVSRRSVISSLAELKRAGHIGIKRGGRRKPNRITVLTASVQAPAKVSEPIEQCTNCNRGLRAVAGGICAACAREEAKASLYLEAKAELPAGAEHEEIALRAEQKRLGKRYKQAARDAARLERIEQEWAAS